VSQITREDGNAIAIQADVSKAIVVKRLFEETEKAFGSPNVLVNSAGVFKFEPWRPLQEKNSIASFDTNVLGQSHYPGSLKHFPGSGGSIRYQPAGATTLNRMFRAQSLANAIVRVYHRTSWSPIGGRVRHGFSLAIQLI